MQQLWNSQASANYNYVIKKQCFCSPGHTREMRVIVVADNIIGAIYTDTHEKVSEEIVGQLITISQWFDEIFMAINNESDEVEVRYNKNLGHPVSIRIDKNKRRSDDEYNVVISEVRMQ